MKKLLLFFKKALGRIMVQNNAAAEIKKDYLINDSFAYSDIGIDRKSIKYEISNPVTNNKNFN